MRLTTRASVLAALAGCTTAPPASVGPASFAMAVQDVAVLGVGDQMRAEATWYDSSGVALTTPRATFVSSDPRVVSVDAKGQVTALATGEATVVASVDDARFTFHVRVPSAPTTDAVVDLFPAARYQVITGWEAAAGTGEADCNRTAVAKYQPEVTRRAIEELGITRLRLALRSGTESRVDLWADYRAGRMDYAHWRATWMVATNDDADPAHIDSAGFQWGYFDAHLEAIVLPMREALARRGERLEVNLNYVDFFLTRGEKAFAQMKDPEEYAELILAAFLHMQGKYGFVPDAVELNLEPENTAYSAIDMGRALVATARRLRAAGFAPRFVGPSSTRAANAVQHYDAMIAVPGARGLLSELAYHTYTGVSDATRQAIRLRALRDQIHTAMLEHIGAGFDGLYADLTMANVSAWEQFTLAYCGRRDRPENGGVYYQVNQSDSLAPRVNLTNESKLLRQVFAFVRPGAVRIGATSAHPDVRPLAFTDTLGGTVVVLRSTARLSMHVRGLPPGNYGVNYSTRADTFNVELPPVVVDASSEAVIPPLGDVAVTLYPLRGGVA